MSKGVERCTVCHGSMAERTNGNGLAYLECTTCWVVEVITRQPDPYPSATKTYTYGDGRTRTVTRGRIPRSAMHKKSMGPQ